MWKWALNEGSNRLIGALLVSLIVLFTFLNGIPWESKSVVAAFKSDVQRELSEMKDDVREIRRLVTILINKKDR